MIRKQLFVCPFLVAIVALQAIGCSHVPTLRQGGSSVSQRTSTRHHIVQGGDGSLWVSITLPAQSSNPGYITQGPDGKMWFTQEASKGYPYVIGNIDMSGTVTEFDVPSVSGQITTGSDGALWFVAQAGRSIGRITTSGTTSYYPISKPKPAVGGITTGSDGNVWFTDAGDGSVGKITPHGKITLYLVPKPNGRDGVYGITNGPDGNVWFTSYYKDKIGSVSPSGHFRFFSIPTPNSYPGDIALGGDGNLYFIEQRAFKIGEITRFGKVTEYALPSPDVVPVQIAKGFSGSSMWITDVDFNTKTMQLRQFIIQSKSFTPPIIPPYTAVLGGMHAGPDGNMWVFGSLQFSSNVLVSLTHVLTTDPSSVEISGVGQIQSVQIHETQNKGGSYTAVSSDQSIATVGPVSQTNSFDVTAQGAGSCSIRVSDSIGNYIDVPVSVSVR